MTIAYRALFSLPLSLSLFLCLSLSLEKLTPPSIEKVDTARNVRDSYVDDYNTGLSQLPIFIDRPWFHGMISRQEAEKRMREMDMNTFLLRESANDSDSLVLSVKNGDKCYHFPIDHGVGKYEIQGTHMPFSSVNELVDYYIQNGLPESQSGKSIQLIKPCTFDLPEKTQPRMEHYYNAVKDIDHNGRY